MRSPQKNTDSFFIITGGPGVGKTTLLQELQKRLFTCIPEVAREIIQEEVAAHGDALPWKNKELYLQKMFDRSVKSYLSVNDNSNSLKFFDRGIPDSLTYAEIIGCEEKDTMENIARNYRYNPHVFYLFPWREIYETDDERKQSWEEAVFTSELNAEIYRRYNYTLIDVPNGTPETRVDFILERIGKMNLCQL